MAGNYPIASSVVFDGIAADLIDLAIVDGRARQSASVTKSLRRAGKSLECSVMRLLRILTVSSIVIATALLLAASSQAAWGVKDMVGKDGGLGGLGLGSGQLLEPSDAAVGPDGEIYVAVPTDCSVRVFAADGTPLRKFGGCMQNGVPSDNLLPTTIQWIAVDAKSRVYVANTNMIVVTDRNGDALEYLGSILDPYYSLLTPTGLAVTDTAPNDPAGSTSLYFGDSSKHHVAKFSVAYDDNDISFDWIAGGDVINGNGSSGYEVCTDYANCQTGTTDPAHMNNPRDVDIASAAGSLFVNSNYNLLVKIDPTTGVRLSETAAPGGVTWFSIAARADGGFWAAPIGTERGAVLRFDSDGTQLASIGVEGSPSAASDGIGGAMGLTSAQNGDRVVVADGPMHRAGVYDAAGTNLQLVGKNGGIGWQRGTGDGEFSRPSDVAADGADGYWVLDTGNNRVVHFEGDGTFLSSTSLAIGTPNPGQDYGPVGLTSTADGGKLYVADSWNHRIIELTVASGVASFSKMVGYDVVSGDGTTTFEVCTVPANCKAGSSNTTTDAFSFPVDLAVQPGSGEVWVAEQNNNRVHQLTSSLANGIVIGGPSSGSANGQFALPQAIAFEPTGEFWVSEFSNSRVQRFSSTGVFSRWIAQVCDPSPPPTDPRCGSGQPLGYGLAVVGSDLHIVENSRNRVAVYPLSAGSTVAWGSTNFTDEWTPPTGVYGAIGSNAGQFYKPRGIAAIGSDVVIADMMNSRVQLLGDVPGWNAGSITNVLPAESVTQFNKDSVQLTYTAEDANGDELTCTPGSGASVPLPNVGNNSITISCDDPLGDTAITQTVQYLRVVDTTAPTITIDAPLDGSVASGPSAQVDFTFSDDQDSDPTCDRTSGDSVALTAGVNAITVTCSDWAGNSASATVNVTYNPPAQTPPPPPTPVEPVATIKFAKTVRFRGSMKATITCDRACPLELTIMARVGKKRYAAKAVKSLATAGTTTLTVKWRKSISAKLTKSIKTGAKVRFTYVLKYGAKQGKSGKASNPK